MPPIRSSSPDEAPLLRFTGVGGDIAVRDAQDLMAWPFFSLAKSKRVRPIDFRMGEVSILVEATPEHGMATIWDADVLIWVASQLVEARDAGRATSRLILATPHEILTFTRRGTGKASYERLRAALDRLQSTSIATTIRQRGARRRHRFSWINEWREIIAADGRAVGIEMIIPDWFYEGVLDRALVLTIDPGYFELTGGLERWLYRIVRKHGGRQTAGWSFEVAHLYRKSGALSPLKRFAFELRAIVQRQALPGYRLTLEQHHGRPILQFAPIEPDLADLALRRLARRPVEKSA
ncbi:MAG TPA: replication initiator protein A [Erythrobacter sp.]|nr:replication initiator protein A [Erythrobacter sp.]